MTFRVLSPRRQAEDPVRRNRTGALLLAAAVLATTAYSDPLGDLGRVVTGAGGVRTLTKVDSWREGLLVPERTYAVLEVAYDADTAQALWDANIPAGLPAADGDPVQQGQYGDLAGVDFTAQAVAVWSSGQSGTCPGWLSTVRTDTDGEVLLTRDESGGRSGCTDDYNTYRTLVVVDRSDLPEPSELASARGTVEGVVPLRALLVDHSLD